MVKKKLAGVVLAASVAAGIGTGVVAHALTGDEPPAATTPARTSAAPSATATSATPTDEGGESGMAAPDDLTIGPGEVGPVEVGMSKSQALATGYFVADVKAPVDGCPERPLAWKDEYVNTYDVQTLGNGEIRSIGVRGQGVHTAEGLGVGSTLDEVRSVYPDAKLLDAGYVQSGIAASDPATGGWIGFLFDHPPTEVLGSDRASFVELTRDRAPSLMRDGC